LNESFPKTRRFSARAKDVSSSIGSFRSIAFFAVGVAGGRQIGAVQKHLARGRRVLVLVADDALGGRHRIDQTSDELRSLVHRRSCLKSRARTPVAVARSFATKSMEVMEDSVDGFFEYVFGSFSLTTFVS
jgi:hypothetical protein